MSNTMDEVVQKTTLDVVMEISEFANAVASLLVGHRKILVEGGFDPNMADHMSAGLHAKLLGLDLIPEWEPEWEPEFLIDEEGEDDE